MNNKRNKKGFTLVELLAVILVLSLVVGISIYSAIFIIDSSKAKKYKIVRNNIEKQSVNYLYENTSDMFWNVIEDNDGYEYKCITIQNLVDMGYFDEKKIIGSEIGDEQTVSSDDYIYISREVESKTVVDITYLNGDVEDKENKEDLCGKSTNGFNGNVSIKISPTVWSDYVDVTITYKVKNAGDVKDYVFDYEYVIDENVDYEIDESKRKATVISEDSNVKKLKVFYNGTVYGCIKSESNGTGCGKSIDLCPTCGAERKITNIDKTSPIIDAEDIVKNFGVAFDLYEDINACDNSDIKCNNVDLYAYLGNKEIKSYTELSIGENEVLYKAVDPFGNESTKSRIIDIIQSKPSESGCIAKEEEFIVPKTGYYKLEVWGAQGTSTGYGGYSTGVVKLEKEQKLYINVGCMGVSPTGGYNGGGDGIDKACYEVSNMYITYTQCNDVYTTPGGGATHIATTSGLLSSLEDEKDKILIVAGGGGTTSGGGFMGKTINAHENARFYEIYGGGQTSGYKFGQGGHAVLYPGGWSGPGGGGGFYGGDGSIGNSGSAGGSGYIGNSLLTDKFMYCYNCETSDDYATKTYSTTNVSEEAISDYAKKGDGYAKITYLSDYEEIDKSINSVGDSMSFEHLGITNYLGEPQMMEIPYTGYYRLEVWGGQGYNGGYGGYSTGVVQLTQNQKLYIYIGGQGGVQYGGYNGGGDSAASTGGGGGGGATHIATTSGLLSQLSKNIDSILVVAGGGGKSTAGGGFEGVTSGPTSFSTNLYYVDGGTQSSGYMFGQGGNGSMLYDYVGTGGGGGFYGGKGSSGGLGGGGAGGSGYIGNNLLINKYMYCYNCTTSSDISTKTYSTTNVSEEPKENYAKIGNGYAKVTYLGDNYS